jgi:2'-hydroxyisoflavone reductase
MHLLVVGGTRFIGRHVVDRALARGHDVTVFHRGRSGAGLWTGDDRVTVRLGDRNSDLSGLAHGSWDATVDTCAFVPRHVQSLADVLGVRGGRYLLVSSVSAYAPPSAPGITEDAPLATVDDPTVEEVTGETYGGLKVLCEQAATDRFGPDTVVVRPTYVVGPDDYSWRFPWWVRRIAEGGAVLAPGPADNPMQVIDVRDMADWMVGLLEQQATGAFHAASPPPPFSFGDLLEAVRSTVGPQGTHLVWLPVDVLRDAGLADGALPLWGGDDDDLYMLTADPARATATGLRPRPLAETIQDTLDWVRRSEMPPGTGLDPATEAQLLASWQDGQSTV